MNIRSLPTITEQGIVPAAQTLLHRLVDGMFGELRLDGLSILQGPLTPKIDVVEKDDGLEITAEMPGLEKDDISVELAGDTLLIRGEKRQRNEKAAGDRKVTERSYGSFSRAIDLPPGAKSEDIDARLDKGVLILKLPKGALKHSKAKRIEIKAA